MSWKETAAAIYAAALAPLQREGRPRIERGIVYRSAELDGMTVQSAEAGKHGHILDIWPRAGSKLFSMRKMPDGETNAEREHPGELIHLDIKKLGRIGSVGHRITGRYRGAVNRHHGIGWEFVHICIDDASRRLRARHARSAQGKCYGFS